HPADPAVAVVGVPGDRAGDSFFPAHLRRPAGLALELLVADAQRDDLARTRPVAALDADKLAAGRPVALLLADAQDQLGPVLHRGVLALPVDVHVAGDPAG